MEPLEDLCTKGLAKNTKMKVVIDSNKFRSVLFPVDNEFYDSNVEIDIPFSKAFRMTRYFPIQADFERVPYDPDTFYKEKKFGFVSDIDQRSGWGNVTTNLLRNSREYNISLSGREYSNDDPYVKTLLRKDLYPNAAMIWHEQPRDEWFRSPFEHNLAIVPFETTKIPPSWVRKINSFKGLMVPCEQNIQMMKDSGVTIPIELIHWGVDPKKFFPLEREESDIFTFGTMGALSVRKGTDILVDAFRVAFPTEKDVRLICKTSYNGYPFMVPDDRIKVEMTGWTHQELIDNFFKRINCFVFPTRGEGFGLPPLEAMATGVPAIATGWSGITEFLTDEYGWLLDYKMVPAKDFSEKIYKEDCGEWAEPDFNQLVKLLRYAYEHRDEAKEKGKKAAQYVQDYWTWEKKIPMFHQAIDKLMNAK